jgi:predicted ATPase/DNA-binding SARP family transcriptional activator
MRYRLLGNLVVTNEDGTSVTIPAAKRRALLAILLLERGRAIHRDAVIEALWGDAAPNAATNSLFSHVSRLRTEIGIDAIRSVPGGYALPLGERDLDVVVAEREVAAGRRALAMGHAPAAATVLAQALSRWQGPALAEFRDAPFAQPEIAKLEQLHASALEDRIEADLALQRHHDLVPELEQLVYLHPLRERMWGQLMLALYRSGRQADALDRYRELRRRLVADLGLDPSPELQELQRRILSQDHTLAAPMATGRVVDLPQNATRTVGRAHEIELARATLAGSRLLTLTGPGGVGKTRLAMVVAESLIPEHPDGTQFVDLSMVREPEQVLERIGSVVGGGGRPDVVIGERRMLLVLDNFEQVLQAARSVAILIAACPNLDVIVTSRAPLRIGAERQLEVPPLNAADSAALFRDRASSAVGVEALPGDLVREVVDRLDGLPLAVELAAARTKVLAIAAIRDLLSDQMGLLTSGRRDSPDRHRTMRDTIRWSYELLDPETQPILRKLSVLAPGFDLEAALVVGEASIDGLEELVDHSLVHRTGNRYALLETIRAFAEEAAGEAEAAAARTRHLRFFARLPTGSPLQPGAGPEDPEAMDRWLDLCASNQENLRLAFARATEAGDVEAIAELFLGVGLYWAFVGTTEEFARWTRIALDRMEASRPKELERVRLVASEFARWSGDAPFALELLGLVLASATDRGDLEWIGNTLLFMALTHASVDEYEQAWALLDRAEQTHRAEGHCAPGHREHLLGVTIDVLLRQNRVDEADAIVGAFTAEHQAAPRWRLGMIEADLELGAVAGAAGRRDEAKVLLGRVIIATADLKFRRLLADALDALAGVDRIERPAVAARLVGMADRMRAESRAACFYVGQRQALVDHLVTELGSDAYETARGAGQAFTVAEIPTAALADTV